MDAKDIKIGLKVIPYHSREDLSTVVSLPDQQGHVLCKYASGLSYEVPVKSLSLYDEEVEKKLITETQLHIDQSVNLFEQAFAMLQKARETAEAASLSIQSNEFDVSKLEDVIESNGWEPSSFWC